MEAVVDGWIMFVAWVQDCDYIWEIDDIWIDFESLRFLYHQDTLDKSLISVGVMQVFALIFYILDPTLNVRSLTPSLILYHSEWRFKSAKENRSTMSASWTRMS